VQTALKRRFKEHDTDFYTQMIENPPIPWSRVTGYRIGRNVINSWQGLGILSLLRNVQPGSGAHLASGSFFEDKVVGA
jgi:hypothetical protein